MASTSDQREDQPSAGRGVNEPRSILESLQRSHSTQRNVALQTLGRQLQHYAKRYLGQQEGRADLQAESIVQSVMGRALAEGFDHYRDEDHLRAGLRQRVRHLILDRKKKNRPGAMPHGDDDKTLDPSAQGPGPGTQVAHRELEQIDRRQREAFIDWCLAAPITARQKQLLAAYLEGRSWQEIADSLRTTTGAAKKMMSEMRPKVLAHILEPLRTKVDGRCWGLIELHFIGRRSIESSATALGLNCDTAQYLLAHKVQAAFKTEFGGSVRLSLLQRMLGYTRG